MIVRFVLTFFIAGCCHCASGQSSAAQKVKPEAKQTLDGTAEVFVHLGGKLVDELKNRLNIESSASQTATENVKVIYDFGLFKLERDETRPVRKP